MRYLKTNFYAENEVPMLLLNIAEAYDHIDKFLVYEFNHTKSGLKKEYVDLRKWWNYFEPYEDKIQYWKIDVSCEWPPIEGQPHHDFVVSDDPISEAIQKTVNEPYSRNFFTNMVDIKDDDYIFSVDADEIIYGRSYDDLVSLIDKREEPVRTRMHFFWNRINHLTSKPWTSPIACKYKHLKNKTQNTSFGETKYSQWRDEGNPSDSIVGCHFSNCYMNEEQFEFRKRAIYYKPTSYGIQEVSLDDSIMPKKIKDVQHVFEEFNLC